MSLKIKTGDKVLVITGKDKGKQGKVIAASPVLNKVVVEGVNIVTKHQKARSTQEQSAIVKKEAPISASNVLVVCPSCGKPTRVGHKIVDGKKQRICKKCGATISVIVESTPDKKEDKKSEKKDSKKSK